MFHGTKGRTKVKKASDICTGLKGTRISTSLVTAYGTHTKHILVSAKGNEAKGNKLEHTFSKLASPFLVMMGDSLCI